MAALSIQVPYPVFYDRDGQPLDNGNIYIGVANLDPVTNPLQVYYDDALTIAASQPLVTSGGYVYRNGTPTQLYVNAGDFSITVNDSKDLFVYNFPTGVGISSSAASIEYDPPFVGAVTSGYTVADKLAQTVSVQDFGAVGDGVADDTAAIQAAITACNGVSKLFFPRGTYLFSTPLTISNIDVEFNKSILIYTGSVGSFALTLNSDAGASLEQKNGNRFSDFTLRQQNWAEYITFSGSAVYDPPSIASFANLTNIVPNAPSTTVSVPGARAGGYARATFTSLVDGVVLAAAVTADDVVTVWFNNYVSAAIDMPSGTLNVTVVNNAFHGLCLGGALGILENAKVIGFTGVSLALGQGRDQITGVVFSGGSQCYYWKVHANVAPAAGWGIVVRPRNNENTFNLSLFPINAYGDSIPRRACCINQLVMSGLTNGIEALSLESVSSEEAFLITDAAACITSSKVIYYESNTSFASPPAPYIRAQTFSAGCSLTFRVVGVVNAIVDEGFANDLQSIMAFYINGRQASTPEGGPNLVFNGDFLNGFRGWSNFSSGVTTITYPGDGYLSGKRMRVDLTSGRINIQQACDQFGPFVIAGLEGKTITAGAWLKTNLNGMVIRANGLANASILNNEQWQFSCVTLKQANATDLDVSIIDNSSLTQTGYIEISNVSCTIGRRTIPLSVETKPEGSATYNPPSLAAGATATTTVSVLGAELGDLVIGLSFSLDLAGVTTTGYVSAADTVTVVFKNETAGVVDLGSGTLRALLQKS